MRSGSSKDVALFSGFFGRSNAFKWLFSGFVCVCVCVCTGLHYGKESVRSSGGHDLHNFISSGFVTLGRGPQKGRELLLELLT